jgi:hypothetical protein
MIVRDRTTNTDRVLFSSNRDNLNAGSAGFELYAMKTDGSGLTRLTNNNVYDGFNQEFLRDQLTQQSYPPAASSAAHAGSTSTTAAVVRKARSLLWKRVALRRVFRFTDRRGPSRKLRRD